MAHQPYYARTTLEKSHRPSSIVRYGKQGALHVPLDLPSSLFKSDNPSSSTKGPENTTQLRRFSTRPRSTSGQAGKSASS